MNEDFPFGIFIGVVLCAAIFLGSAMIRGVGKTYVIEHCNTYGKVEVGGKLYECSFKEVSK